MVAKRRDFNAAKPPFDGLVPAHFLWPAGDCGAFRGPPAREIAETCPCNRYGRHEKLSILPIRPGSVAGSMIGGGRYLMREMLEPIFGETGAIIAQFVITLIVVLLLIAVVVWLVRRYSGGAFMTGGRGRLPRLAIVDAMAVDGRRRLVLVRRDNVEHLLLIGGPSDIVVEPTILRTRTAAARTPQQAGVAVPSGPAAARGPIPSAQPPAPTRAAPPPAPAEPPPPPQPAAAPMQAEAAATPSPAAPRHGRVGIDQPIPFPPRRSPAPPRPAVRREESAEASEAASAASELRRRSRFAPGPSQPAALAEEPAAGRSDEVAIETIFAAEEEAPPPPVSETEPPEPMMTEGFSPPSAEEENYAPPMTAEAPGDDEPVGAESTPPSEVEMAEATAPAEAEPAQGTRVSDLEKEMARLLGEISGRR
jgi:flagellar biogenesis protein FliO